VFNAAAVKHVPISEYNPIEAIRVNIIGLENIIQGSLNYNVKKLIQITTDKTINPTTVKGETFFYLVFLECCCTNYHITIKFFKEF
jgi:FlaA1/EpsC-like NDP-sugar epimerase